MNEHHDPIPAPVTTAATSVPTPPVVAPTRWPPEADPTAASGHDVVRVLQQRVDALQTTVTGLHAQVTHVQREHQADVAAIGQALLREARDRSWCEDYDEFVEALNQDLHVRLPLRERAYEVCFDLRVTLRIDRARDIDHAREQAEQVASHLEDRVSRIDPVASCDADHGDDFDITDAD